MDVNVPEVSLSGARGYPMLGLGTLTFINVTGGTDTIYDAVKTAIDVGYRHFDCAFSYANEKSIGDAIQEKIKSGAVKREDLFITTKLYETHHNPEKIFENFSKSFQDLQCEYIDLYLLHWPFALKDGDVRFPRDENGKLIYSDYDYIDTYRAMETLVDAGMVKALGISNFNSKQVDRLLQNCRIKPVNIQIEVHPYMANEKLIQFCRERGLTVTAYAVLGSPGFPSSGKDKLVLLNDPTLMSIAKAKNKTVAQVCLRYLIQRGIVAVAKTVTESRLRENIQIFDFELTDDEMKTIRSLDRGHRFYGYEEVSDHKYYPFSEEF